MHPSVKAAWHRFSEPLEGRVHSLYCDVLGLVTTGVGNLIDSPGEATKLPWKLPDGSLASEVEVHRQWHIVKDDRERLKKLHWKYAAALTTIRITDDDIDELVKNKLESNEDYLTWHHFLAFAEFPADAQLAILSMAWAAGPGFPKKFPNFTRSVLDGKWWEAAVSGKLRETGPDGTPNPGVIPRNKANRLCFENAGDVLANDDDRTALHWPSRYIPPMLRRDEDPPPLAPPAFHAEAVAAADQSRLDLLEQARRETNRELASTDDPAIDEEVTEPDGKGNV